MSLLRLRLLFLTWQNLVPVENLEDSAITRIVSLKYWFPLFRSILRVKRVDNDT